jgi:glycosyltransferase involved in cell wall biosynthesis
MRAGALSALALIGVRHAPGLVVTVHNAPPETGRRAARLVYLALERLVARRADLVLCVSSDLEQRMRAKGARRVGRAIVPAPGQAALGEAAPAEASPPRTGHEDRPVVLAVGRLAPQKDFATLLDAAAHWQDRDPRPRLVIAGDGPLRDELARQAARDGVDAEFPGQVDDVPARLREAAVFVLPSRWEGQPLILQEALRAGAAIVATRTGGIPDLTGATEDTEDTEDTGNTGNTRDIGAAILVPPGDPRRLARAVREVLADDRTAATLRENARARAATLPSAEQAVTTVLADYTRLPK